MVFFGKVFTSLILIIFPFSFTIFTLPDAVNKSLSNENDTLTDAVNKSLSNVNDTLPDAVNKSLSNVNEYLNPILYPIVIPHQPSYPVVFPPILLFIVLFGFSIYPSIYPTRIFFKKRGFENVVIEYHYIKKILLVSIIILITFLSLFLVSISIESIINKMAGNDSTQNLRQQKIETIGKLEKELPKELETLNKNDTNFNITYGFRSLIEKLESIYSNDTVSNTSPMIQKLNDIASFHQLTTSLYYSIFYILTIPFSIIIKLLLEHSRKLFKLYIAKGCFKIVLEISDRIKKGKYTSDEIDKAKYTSDEIDKIEYFIRGLLWYNKFLQKIIKLQINNIDKISEKVFKPPFDDNKLLLPIAKSVFYSKDGFEPLRRILTIFVDIQEEIILIKEPIRTKLQESSDLLIPIITIIITIITTFFFKSLS